MEKLLNKQMEEFIEILESDKNLTSEDVWTSPEKKEWFKLKQQELLKEALAEERERVVGEMKYILDFAESDKEMADNPEDPKVRINYFRDRLDEILDKPLTDKE